MEIYDTYSVFTPTSPARLTFVERDAVNSRLVDALRTPGMQVVVYGHSGSGKTTLLVNKLFQLYEKHITSRCMKGVTFEQLVLDAFDQLATFYCSEMSSGKKNSTSAQLSQDYLAIKSQINSTSSFEENTKLTRILPPQLTPQALARFMGEAKTCWVLEDFHKISHDERTKLSQVMKVFMDMADEYRSLKVIAIGAVDTARQVVEYDPEMKNRIAEIQVPLMKKSELEEIIIKGGRLLNIEFDGELTSEVGGFSNGMASVCHQLCLNICTSEEIYETKSAVIRIDSESLPAALQMYLEQSSDTIKKAFDTAFRQKRTKKYDNSKIILRALSELPQEGASRSEIYARILKSVPDYPQGNMSRFIEILSKEGDGSLLRYDIVSGRYSFKDPIYRAFALAYFSTPSNRLSTTVPIDLGKFLQNMKIDFDAGRLKGLTIKFSKID